MYELPDHWAMITDAVRRDAYVRALRAAILPGAVVTEIGTGSGYFAVIACKAGAARVHAIEQDPVIQMARELAQANGCADRIEFIHGLSTRASLPPADVLVSDLRGVLPLWSTHIPSIVDARRRLLRPGGVQIPERDVVSVALARGPAAYDDAPADPHGVRLEGFAKPLANTWIKMRVGPDRIFSAPAVWRTIDYRTVESPDFEGTVELAADRDGTPNGLALWFDAELHCGAGFSNAPWAPAIAVYGQAFFPTGEIALRRGDRVRVSLRAKLVGVRYVWSWSGEVLDGASRGASFERSSFHAEPLDRDTLRKRGDAYVPRLGRDGRARAYVLSRMTGAALLGDIARETLAAFPELFSDLQQALTYVADVSQQLSEE